MFRLFPKHKLYHLFPVIYYENSCDSFFGIGWLCHLKEEDTYKLKEYETTWLCLFC